MKYFLTLFLILGLIVIGCNESLNNNKKTIDKEEISNRQENLDEVKMVDVKPKLTPAEAKSIIENIAIEVANAISTRNIEDLSKYIHPVKGVRFSQYGVIVKDKDLVFNSEQIKNFFLDNKIYNWGDDAGSGEPIEFTTKEYFNKFVYHSDFNEAKINYNEITDNDGYPIDEFNAYPDAILVEYYFAGKEYPQDWKSDRIIFEEYNKKWYVIGFNFNRWSP